MPRGGPYLLSAIICREATRDESGLTTLHELVHSIQAATPLGAVAAPLVYRARLYLAFAAGSVVGERAVSIAYHAPGAREEIVWEGTLPFAPDGVSAYQIELALAIRRAGVHWLTVLCAGAAITRVPLTVFDAPTTGRDTVGG
jgi:hypothetical protein